MSKLNYTNTIPAFAQLGHLLLHPDEELSNIIQSERHYNAWFTPESVANAVAAIGTMLNEDELEAWIDNYPAFTENPKKIGLVLAGNIPLVGFHDVLCVLITGNIALIKASSQDTRLIAYVLKKLTEIEESFAGSFKFVDRLEGFDAIIATGSNNTSRYFEYYFSKVPHIIRKNRNSIALITGDETTGQLHALGHDIFDYFGLGCRNVSKLLVPKGYNFNKFFEAIEDFNSIINHHKYNNNYDYNKSIYLVNRDEHLDNGFLMLKKDERLASPLAVLYYAEYTDLQSAQHQLNGQSEQLQCIVTAARLQSQNQVVTFGQSQHPKLWDYADAVDTMDFLANL